MDSAELSQLPAQYDEIINDSIQRAKPQEMALQYKSFLASDTKLRAFIQDCIDTRSTSVSGDHVKWLQDPEIMARLTEAAIRGLRANMPQTYTEYVRKVTATGNLFNAIFIIERRPDNTATYVEVADGRDQMWFFSCIERRTEEVLLWRTKTADASLTDSIQSTIRELRGKLNVIKAKQDGVEPLTHIILGGFPTVKDSFELQEAIKVFKIKVELAARRAIRNLDPYNWQKDYHLLIHDEDMAEERARVFDIDDDTKSPKLFHEGRIEEVEGMQSLVVDEHGENLAIPLPDTDSDLA